jgi:hypothetical protein
VVKGAQPLDWGRLERFGFDVCRHVLRTGSVDAITVVDSDQLLLRPGYVDALRERLPATAGAGLLSSDPQSFDATTDLGPVRAAWEEAPA